MRQDAAVVGEPRHERRMADELVGQRAACAEQPKLPRTHSMSSTSAGMAEYGFTSTCALFFDGVLGALTAVVSKGEPERRTSVNCLESNSGS